uniref:Uncharacterized protein n=1 Tax=Rhizophagus irregularis (strain DAOM 181602 / DAOM 197198 / MUCL 43194) TaxID=747089 RepID=U9URK4_RHIID
MFIQRLFEAYFSTVAFIAVIVGYLRYRTSLSTSILLSVYQPGLVFQKYPETTLSCLETCEFTVDIQGILRICCLLKFCSAVDFRRIPTRHGHFVFSKSTQKIAYTLSMVLYLSHSFVHHKGKRNGYFRRIC